MLSSVFSFDVPRFRLQRGGELPVARIVVQTHGTLSAARDNAVLFPTWFGTQHTNNAWLIGPGKALDTERYFVIVPNMLGNGLSSSPSNTPPPFDRARFPMISLLDNVRLQHHLVTDRFGIEKLHAVIGRSMGAQQAFQWASIYPAMVPRLLPFCGSARTSRFNYVFLAGIKAALTADADWNNGEYESSPARGLAAVGRLYAAWALSQPFYRARLDQTALGFDDLETFLTEFWEKSFLGRDANNLICQIKTWQSADISDNETFGGDFVAALRAITARTIIMPSRTDLYFVPEDSAFEAEHIPGAELRVIESIWGHRAATDNTDPHEIAFLEKSIRDLLDDR